MPQGVNRGAVGDDVEGEAVGMGRDRGRVAAVEVEGSDGPEAALDDRPGEQLGPGGEAEAGGATRGAELDAAEGFAGDGGVGEHDCEQDRAVAAERDSAAGVEIGSGVGADQAAAVVDQTVDALQGLARAAGGVVAVEDPRWSVSTIRTPDPPPRRSGANS